MKKVAVSGYFDPLHVCLLYTSDAADEADGVDLGGRRIIKKNFLKQKTAYEMKYRLVGSEMCIRDRYLFSPITKVKKHYEKSCC